MNKHEMDELQELNDDDLETVSGGLTLNKQVRYGCPKCSYYADIPAGESVPTLCPKCGNPDGIVRVYK